MNTPACVRTLPWAIVSLSLLCVGCQPALDSASAPAGSIRETVLTKQPSGDAETLSAEDLAEAPAEYLVDPLDWPYCRGPQYNGVSPETGLPDDWNPRGGEGSNVAWMNPDLGGRSTPIVMNGRLYTIVRADPGLPTEGERVVCVDPQTGELIWENRFNVWLSDVPDTRVGWSSVVGDPETNLVFALGVCGYFQCIDGETGETVWDYPMHERFGLLSTFGGRTNFPIVVDDVVIISGIVIGWGESARPTHRFYAFDKKTGEIVWIRGTRVFPYDTSYSAPVMGVFDGTLAMVVGSGDGSVWALQPRTGVPIWHYDFSRRGLNAPPLVVGERVYVGHSEENLEGTLMGAVAAIDATGHGDITTSGRIWQYEEWMCGKNQPLYIDGRLYAFDDRGKMYIIDAETGEQIGDRQTLGTMVRASTLYVDGKIYVLEANGRWFIFRPTEDGVETVSRGRMPSGEECHAAPICSHGRIFIQTTGALYCLADPEKKEAEEDVMLPVVLEEAPLEDTTPAHVQVVPAELLLYPGDTQQLTVRLYNAVGQYLGESEAEFTVDGPGEISEDGLYLAPAGDEHVAAKITARVGELEGTTSARIIPGLPWSFDFDDITINEETGTGMPPVTWVGARSRHVIREVDGNLVMVKVTTIPKGTRSQAWFGHSDFSDYTFQADVMGAITDDKMPDIGIIAQGYCLDLQGQHQKLQIRTWVPQLRMAETVPFEWEPNRWYTMKFMATVEDGQAVLRGKVWPRDEPEPEEWTLTAYDPSPNVQGSPGLYGNAKDAEIFLDNFSITPNSP